MTSTFYDFM